MNLTPSTANIISLNNDVCGSVILHAWKEYTQIFAGQQVGGPARHFVWVAQLPTSGTPSLGATGWETSFIEQFCCEVTPSDGADCNEGELKRSSPVEAGVIKQFRTLGENGNAFRLL